MKILSIGNFTRGWDGSICDEEHIAQALERMGHEVTRLPREQTREAYWKLPQVDFALIAQWDGYNTDVIQRLRFFTDIVVYWAFDYQADGQEWHERLVKDAVFYLSKRIADSRYPNWHWFSQDFAPAFLDKYEGVVKKDIDVLFTGSYLPWATERNQTLKAVDEQFDLHIYSVTPNEWRAQGFKNVFGPCMDEALPELIARAKVNLSIDHTIEAGYWSDRNAQIMVCGGFVLFRYVPLSSIIFNNHVAYFYNIEDCLYKVRHYLENEFEREHIATTGYAHAHRSLMVDHRVEQLLTIVKNYSNL